MKSETCYWDEETRKLAGNKMNKVRQYLREGLIKRTATEGTYNVHPGLGRHLIHQVDMNRGTCTCQAYVTNGMDCSHILAIRLALSQEQEGNRKIKMEGEQ